MKRDRKHTIEPSDLIDSALKASFDVLHLVHFRAKLLVFDSQRNGIKLPAPIFAPKLFPARMIEVKYLNLRRHKRIITSRWSERDRRLVRIFPSAHWFASVSLDALPTSGASLSFALAGYLSESGSRFAFLIPVAIIPKSSEHPHLQGIAIRRPFSAHETISPIFNLGRDIQIRFDIRRASDLS